MANFEENKEREEGINLEQYGLLFLSHWYYFVGVVIITMAIGVMYILRTTPIYTRTTQLLIKNDEQGSSGAALQEFKDLGLISTNTNINNEIITLSAPIMMESVARRLNLDTELLFEKGLRKYPLYNDTPVSIKYANTPDRDVFFSFKLHITSPNEAVISNIIIDNKSIEKSYTSQIDGDFVRTPVGSIRILKTPSWNEQFVGRDILVNKYPLSQIGKMYSSRLSVALTNKDATVLNLTISDAIPDRADDILLTLIDVYNENWVKDKNRIAESTNAFINERLETITKELGEVDKDISDYKSKNLLPDLQATLAKDLSQSGKNYESLLTLSNQLSMTKFIRQHLSDKENQLLPSNTGIPSSGLEAMIMTYNQLMLERNEYLSNTEEGSHIVQVIDRKLAAQKTAIVRSLDNLIVQIQQQINNIQKSEEEINTQIAQNPLKVRELQSVERQQKVKEALYIFLLQKREENELSRTYTAWNTSVIQPPTGSGQATSPKKSMILLMSFVIGLVIPGVILFLKEATNYKVRGRKDLEGLATPLIGEIPRMSTRKHWWQKNRLAPRTIVVEQGNKDVINESFRLVRTNLDYFIGNNPEVKVIMFTSFNPGSGKSFISANLSKTFSLRGKKVLVVDMDLRRCSLSHLLSEKKKNGITSYLNGQCEDLNSIIVKNAFGNNVDVLPVGTIPPNPTELLYNDTKLGIMFDEVRKQYDYIFLDCPPIEIVADASIIKKYADVSIFVVRAGLMDRRVIGRIDEMYNENQYNKLGIILNATSYVSGKYGHYQYGYSYGYSYGSTYEYHNQ